MSAATTIELCVMTRSLSVTCAPTFPSI
jgi:hypothetical protein